MIDIEIKNINTREVIWLGNQLIPPHPGTNSLSSPVHSVKSSWFDFMAVGQEFSFQNIMVRSHLSTVTNITIVEWQPIKSRRTPWFALGGLSIKLNNIEQHFDFYQAVNCQLSTNINCYQTLLSTGKRHHPAAGDSFQGKFEFRGHHHDALALPFKLGGK